MVWYYLKIFATIVLSIVSISLMINYTCLCFGITAENIKEREVSTFLSSSLSLLTGTFIWMIWDPLAREAWMILAFISFMLGALLQQSALSPFRLAQFWLKLAKK